MISQFNKYDYDNGGGMQQTKFNNFGPTPTTACSKLNCKKVKIQNNFNSNNRTIQQAPAVMPPAKQQPQQQYVNNKVLKLNKTKTKCVYTI